MNEIEMGQKHREQEYLLSGIGVMKVVDELSGSFHFSCEDVRVTGVP
jgi:hypothetical protein